MGVGFAVEMLEKHGEFFPYGWIMKKAGDVEAVGYDDGRASPASQDVIDGLNGVFRVGAASGDYRATALFFDVRASLLGSTEPQDAIAVALDHRDDYSIVVYLPYSVANGQVTLGEVSASQGDGSIFPTNVAVEPACTRPIKQHLIDPEICIRCYTCEA